jgi:hypothetical protein
MSLEADLEQATLKAAELFNQITMMESQVRARALTTEEQELNLSKLQTYIAILSERLGLISVGLDSIKWNLQLGLALSAIRDAQKLSEAVTNAAKALPSSTQIAAVQNDIRDLMKISRSSLHEESARTEVK